MPLSHTTYPSTPQAGSPGQRPGRNPHSADSLLGDDYEAIPYRVTPPWDEFVLYDEPDREYTPHVTAEIGREDEILHQAQNLAFGHLAFSLDWYNDDQYGWPPPGAPNDQPFQTGHTSIVVHDQALEQGWGADPAFSWPRYPHMENKFPGYSAGIWRRNGQWEAQKILEDRYTRHQQPRDLRLRDQLAHRQHNVVVADAPSVTNTANTVPIDPTTAAVHDFGPAGVTPDW